jgi:hypothetical protein
MHNQTRQLAANMFTDFVSYTALMGSDDQKTFTILRTVKWFLIISV